MRHTVSKFTAFFVAVLAAAFLLPAQSNADAHCPASRDGVSVTLTGQRNVEFWNSSSGCRTVGIAVHGIYAESSVRHPEPYSRGEYQIQPGKGLLKYALIPPCKYIIDTFVGIPLRTAASASDYGDRLLQEALYTEDSRFCPPPGPLQSSVQNGNIQFGSGQQQPSSFVWLPPGSPTPTPASFAGSQTPWNPGEISYTYPDPSPSPIATPAPQPRRIALAPLPSPRATPVPLPQPRVLGASITPTSVNPLVPPTGSDVAVPLLALLTSATLSGIACILSRRHENLHVQIRRNAALSH